MTMQADGPGAHDAAVGRPAMATRAPGGAPAEASTGQHTSPLVLVLIFVGFVSLGLPDGLLGVAWPSIRQTFGLPIDALGALFPTIVCGYLAASLTSGWVVKRLGVGLLLALSAFATAMSLLTFALAPAWAFMIVVGVLAGLGGGAIDAGLNSYVALLHSPRLLSWLHACFGVGAATGPAIMLAVLEAGQPWRLGYAIVGTGQLLLGLCFLLTRRQWQTDEDVTSEPEEALTPALSQREREQAPDLLGAERGAEGEVTRARSLRTWGPAVWLSIVLFLVYTGIETAAGQWSYTLFVEGRGFTVQAASIAVSVYWGALALGRVLAGVIANRIAPATLTRWSMVGMLAGAALIWLNLGPWLSFGGLGLMGLSAAAVFPSLIGVTPARFGADRAATIIGFQVGAAALGIAGLPALSGVLAARVGLEIIPVLLVVACAGMIGLHELVVRLAAREATAEVAG
jgi:fucose permease